MGLHIKLPKGKTATTCERVAVSLSHRIAVENDRYRVSVETWRKSNVNVSVAPPRPSIIDTLEEQYKSLQEIADMAKHSTGDVYVSVDLWRQIKGWF